MDHETKYVLVPLFIIIFPEMVSCILGISDVAIGGYYVNKGPISDQESNCGDLAPIPGILIAVGIFKIISYILFIDQQPYKYKFHAFVAVNICVCCGAIILCILAFEKQHLGCIGETIINYTTGVSIFRLFLYIACGIIILVVSIQPLSSNPVISGQEQITEDSTKKDSDNNAVTGPQISVV
jgi:hypothetical protein